MLPEDFMRKLRKAQAEVEGQVESQTGYEPFPDDHPPPPDDDVAPD
jgi:hypothetical protein